MPFDSNWPPLNAELTSAAFRAQFNGLNDKLETEIAALPPPVLDASLLDFSGVPASDPQQAGKLWNDNGALKISARPLPLAITSTSPIPQHFSGTDYAYDFTAANGTPPYTWQIVAGGISGDYTLFPNGHLSGNSTDGTDYGFTVQVTDAAQQTATLEVSWPFGG